MAAPPPSLKGRALRLLGMREHSRVELERKLQRYEASPGELADVLDALQAKGFINARRVVESVVHRRSAKLGVARIRQELNGKGLDAGLVRDAMAGLQATELERAGAVWRKKFGRPSDSPTAHLPMDAAGLARQVRYLAARGFGGDTIRRVVSGAQALLDEQVPDQ